MGIFKAKGEGLVHWLFSHLLVSKGMYDIVAPSSVLSHQISESASMLRFRDNAQIKYNRYLPAMACQTTSKNAFLTPFWDLISKSSRHVFNLLLLFQTGL